VVLGFTGVHGHRAWRRVRGVLVARGHLGEILGRNAAGKPVKAVK
jgi:hypothetical protein